MVLHPTIRRATHQHSKSRGCAFWFVTVATHPARTDATSATRHFLSPVFDRVSWSERFQRRIMGNRMMALPQGGSSGPLHRNHPPLRLGRADGRGYGQVRDDAGDALRGHVAIDGGHSRRILVA